MGRVRTGAITAIVGAVVLVGGMLLVPLLGLNLAFAILPLVVGGGMLSGGTKVAMRYGR